MTIAWVPRCVSAVRVVLFALITPLLEKNVLKTLHTGTTLVFSMRRLIVMAFAVAVLRQLWHSGVAAWPDATLAITVVLALPILGALEHVKPAEVIELAKVLVGRFGVGAGRPWTVVGAPTATNEPSKYDDHRDDA
jgi:hypothetical protein